MTIMRDNHVDMIWMTMASMEPSAPISSIGEARAFIVYMQELIQKEYDKAPPEVDAQGSGLLAPSLYLKIANDLYNLGTTYIGALTRGFEHLEDYNEIDEDARGDLQNALKVLYMIATSIPAARDECTRKAKINANYDSPATTYTMRNAPKWKSTFRPTGESSLPWNQPYNPDPLRSFGTLRQGMGSSTHPPPNIPGVERGQYGQEAYERQIQRLMTQQALSLIHI